MKHLSFRVCAFILFCLFSISLQAQTVSRNYRQQSMPNVLMDLDKASKHYRITFIYNDLEDYTVTKRIRQASIPDAVRDVVGYYPMTVTVGDSTILVECTIKEDTKLIGRLVDEADRCPLPTYRFTARATRRC